MITSFYEKILNKYNLELNYKFLYSSNTLSISTFIYIHIYIFIEPKKLFIENIYDLLDMGKSSWRFPRYI